MKNVDDDCCCCLLNCGEDISVEITSHHHHMEKTDAGLVASESEK